MPDSSLPNCGLINCRSAGVWEQPQSNTSLREFSLLAPPSSEGRACYFLTLEDFHDLCQSPVFRVIELQLRTLVKLSGAHSDLQLVRVSLVLFSL